MRFLRTPVQIIRAELGPYLALNVLMYGLLLVGMATGMLFPDLHSSRLRSMADSGTTDLVVSLLSNAWVFAATILAVNTLTVGLASILVPSMIVPLAGILVFAYHAFTIGLTLAPVDETTALTLIPHSLTILLEFQAYILLLLGAYVLGRSWLRPTTVEAQNRCRGYALGLQRIGWLSLPALTLLIVGAIYESFSLIYLVPHLIAG